MIQGICQTIVNFYHGGMFIRCDRPSLKVSVEVLQIRIRK
jgi:hypothetical protein